MIGIGEVIMDVRKMRVCEFGEQSHLAIVGIRRIDDLAGFQ